MEIKAPVDLSRVENHPTPEEAKLRQEAGIAWAWPEELTVSAIWNQSQPICLHADLQTKPPSKVIDGDDLVGETRKHALQEADGAEVAIRVIPPM
jgi:hypothetical protein